MSTPRGTPCAAPRKPGVALTSSGDVPSIERQKQFIAENGNNIDYNTRVSILRLLMHEFDIAVPPDGAASGAPPGSSDALPGAGLVTETRTGTDVDLNAVGAANPEVLLHVYNIVRARIDALKHPARPDAEATGRR